MHRLSCKRTTIAIVSIVLIYFMQFVLFPNCCTIYYPSTNEALIIFIVLMLVHSIIAFFLSKVRLAEWAIADIIYNLLLCIYNGSGLYGIGTMGLSIDGAKPIYSPKLAAFYGVIVSLAFFVFQVIAVGIRKITKK